MLLREPVRAWLGEGLLQISVHSRHFLRIGGFGTCVTNALFLIPLFLIKIEVFILIGSRASGTKPLEVKKICKSVTFWAKELNVGLIDACYV